MFGLGLGEMMVIGAIALLFVGPDKLPQMMREFGRYYGQLRRAADDLRRAFILEADRQDAAERYRQLQERRKAAQEARKRADEERLRADSEPAKPGEAPAERAPTEQEILEKAIATGHIPEDPPSIDPSEPPRSDLPGLNRPGEDHSAESRSDASHGSGGAR